jgi:hypothetical protein
MRPALHRLKIAAGKLDLSSRERTTSRIAGGDGVSHEATDIDHPAQCEQRARSQPIGAVGIRRNGRRRKLVGQVVDTKQIKTLISDSVEEVSIGTRLVQLAGTTMTTVMDRVGKVNDIVARISAASREKSVAIDEVNRAIAQEGSDHTAKCGVGRRSSRRSAVHAESRCPVEHDGERLPSRQRWKNESGSRYIFREPWTAALRVRFRH